jgi:AcrR family transcriptional regulator
MSIVPTRRRRSPETARTEALAAARALLLEQGPGALTLKAVGQRVGVTHAALIHHFGSAEGLQTALMASMVRDLSAALDVAVERVKAGEASGRLLVETVFEVFETGGAGKLAAWLAVTGDLGRLGAVREAFGDLIEALTRNFPGDEDLRARITRAVLFVTLNAFGDSVIGPVMHDMLGLPEGAARDLAIGLMPEIVRPRE